MQTILIATDFSESSDRALRVAFRLAADSRAVLVILHVASPPTVIQGDGVVLADADLVLSGARERLLAIRTPEDVAEVEKRFEVGGAAREIVRVARESGADLLVLGAPVATVPQRLIPGIADEILRDAPCDVWLASVQSRLAQTGSSDTQHIRRSVDEVEEASVESFPASDTPGWTSGVPASSD